MISKLLTRSIYFHLKMIHQHPKGITNRFKNSADKWVQSLRHPHIKTYQQLFQNQQTINHQIRIELTEKQEMVMNKIKHSYKPGMSALTELVTFDKPGRPDDKDLERDVKDLTIKKFFQEGKQNLTHAHKLVLCAIGFVVLHITLYFIFFYGKELPKNERVKVLNAQILETYHFENQESNIKKIIERIEIVNGQFQKRLSQSKRI